MLCRGIFTCTSMRDASGFSRPDTTKDSDGASCVASPLSWLFGPLSFVLGFTFTVAVRSLEHMLASSSESSPSSAELSLCTSST